MRVLAAADWREAEASHHARVDAWASAHLERRRAGLKHPVEDFLWEYYSLRPAQLRRWHPGPGVVLAGDRERVGWRFYREVAREAEGGAGDVEGVAGHVEGGVAFDVGAFLAERGDTVRFVRDLLSATRERAAQWSCFGLHEWAMVYRADATRHPWPLRLGAAGTDAVVESHALRCTHFDAFRFFTPDAVGRNAEVPTRARQLELEQPGCLHATMDCYKWAYKLGPGVAGELLLDALDVARAARTLDMRAAPYDIAALGYAPILIETPSGKAEYVELQRDIAARGDALRVRLIQACEVLLSSGVSP